MKDYPYGSQSETEAKEVIIPVKLFDLGSGINWRLSEYDPESKVAFCYVTGFYEDEWWTVSLEELESLDLAIELVGIGNIGSTPRVELDRHFTKTKFSELPFNKDNSA